MNPNICRKNTIFYIIALLLLGIAILYPVVIIGIMQNDELQMWSTRLNGIFTQGHSLLVREIYMGRPLRFMFVINALIGQLGNTHSIFIARIIQAFCLSLVFISLGYFIYQLSEKKHLALLTVILAMILMPITFECSAPNVFTAPVTLPLMELLFSLGLFCKYCRSNNRHYLVGTVLLYIVALFGYEFIITYIPLFPLIQVGLKSDEKRFATFIKSTFIAGLIAVTFTGVYFLLQHFMGSNYAGVQVGNVTISGMFAIISTLFKSALPGYWLFNAKYKYLYRIYGISENMALLGIVRLLLILIVVLGLLIRVFHSKNSVPKGSLMIALLAIVYAFIPSLPNSMAKMYQGNVTATNFTALPVSMYLYVAIIIALSILLLKIRQVLPTSPVISILLALSICILIVPIQYGNNIFSKVMNRNFTDLISYENIFKTDFIHCLEGKTIYSSDLFTQNNALFIHPAYWDILSESYDLPINYINDIADTPSSITIYRLKGNRYEFINNSHITVVSPNIINSTLTIRLNNSDLIPCDLQNPQYDHGYYLYYISYTQENESITTALLDKNPF